MKINNLEDKNIWVIGGAGYLGFSIIKALLKQGCRVLSADIDNRAHRMVEKMDHPEGLFAFNLDVQEEQHIYHFAKEQSDKSGIPDGIVVLTYGASVKQLEDLTAEDFDHASSLGITATFLLARAAGQLMEKVGKGSIILFSSMYGMASPDPRIYEQPMNVNPIEYGVGKAGIIQMTKYLAVHWAGKGIRCNCISPGPFPNEMMQKERPEFIDRLSKKVPMGRIGSPEEIAGPVLFLLSDASSYVTGHNLVVDGGWTIW